MSDHELMRGVLSHSQLMDIALAAQMSVPVLVSGDTGARRRACARSIHDACVRERRPFVAISCRTTPALQDGEWDGLVGGAMRGSEPSLVPWFRRAQRGTLYIDALEHMSSALQEQLFMELEVEVLRHAESHRQVRLITGTRPGWPKFGDGSQFSERLFYRLNVMRVDCMPVSYGNPLVLGQQREPEWALRSVLPTRPCSPSSAVSDGFPGRGVG